MKCGELLRAALAVTAVTAVVGCDPMVTVHVTDLGIQAGDVGMRDLGTGSPDLGTGPADLGPADLGPADLGPQEEHCLDSDMDGFGDAADCVAGPVGSPPVGRVAESSDCDDMDGDTFPGAAETDSAVDCMKDSDMDGYGDQAPAVAGVVAGTDCDDMSATAFPGAAELDSASACMEDADMDGYGAVAPVTAGVEPGTDCDDSDMAVNACVQHCEDSDLDTFGGASNCEWVAPGGTPTAGFVATLGDCDDAAIAVFPGAASMESALCTIDADTDGYGDASASATYPMAQNGSDCLDSDPFTFPGAAETESDTDCAQDADEDGWGNASPPAGVTAGNDCNDADNAAVVCAIAVPSCSETATSGTVQLGVTGTGGDGAYTYVWTPATTLDDATSATPMATPTEISTYTVVVTDGAGNSGSTSSTVHLTDGNWVIGGPMAACSAVGLTGTAAAHSFSPDGTQTCTTSNSDATAYVCPTVHRNTRITGTMTVTDDGGDDDWIGFVWGWQNSSQFYILTWKRFAQSVGACSGVAGILIKRFDAQGPITNADLACNQDTPNATVLLSPTDTISTGWTEGIEYGVELLYTEGRTEITITDQTNGVAVVSVVVTDDAYPSGQFGTYDWSQVNACNGPWVSTCTD